MNAELIEWTIPQAPPRDKKKDRQVCSNCHWPGHNRRGCFRHWGVGRPLPQFYGIVEMQGVGPRQSATVRELQ